MGWLWDYFFSLLRIIYPLKINTVCMMGGLGLRETYRASSLPVLNYCGVWLCSHLLSSTWEMIVSLDAVYAGHNKTLSVWPLQKERPRPLQIVSVNLFRFYYISRGDDMLHLCSQPSSQDQHHFWQKWKSFRFELWKYSVTCPALQHFHPEGCCLTKPGSWATLHRNDVVSIPRSMAEVGWHWYSSWK